MSQVVLLDTDFLSAFLKIQRLDLVRDYYRTESLTVPLAVYRELAATELIETLASLPWITVRSPGSAVLNELLAKPDLGHLGTGELQAIAIALEEGQAGVLLTNDNGARHVASRLGVEVVNIPAFLLGCKTTGALSRTRLAEIVVALEQKDHYGFRREIRDLLLE